MLLELAGAGEGRSFSADDLRNVQKSNVSKRLRDEYPVLQERSLLAVAGYDQALRELESVKSELAKTLGPDAVQLAIEDLRLQVSAALGKGPKAAPPPPLAPVTVDQLPRKRH